ncbi:MAG: TetR family transcriptional regulator [Deltaproteobacteria bacterium]|nr:TetR family transcriptional regulator [Deltaproteobacteria bacterium]
MPETVRDFRRGQILRAARQLVAEDGLDALTFAALEERLAFTRGVITYHFKNKDEIVDAVLQSAIDEIDAGTHAEASASLQPEEKVRAVLRANVRGFVENLDAARILFSFWSRLAQDPRARKVNAALYARYREQTARLLRSGQRQGAFGDVSVDALAALLVGVVIGIAVQVHVQPGAIDIEATVEEATQAVLARLRGVSPRVRRRAAGR